MKRLNTPLILLLVLTFFSLRSFAQTPQAMTYQAVARDGNGNPLGNQAISVRISIHDILSSGTVVYEETQSGITTNQFGLFTLQIGNGTPVVSTFSGINWGTNSKFIEIEFDPNGGTNYLNMGTTQLLSVPYALYAAKTGSGGGTDKDSLIINGNELSIYGGNSVLLPSGGSAGDNWGTQTVVSNSTLAGNGTLASPLGIAQQGATTGQTLKWNGFYWQPENDNNTTYSAGSGITFAGTVISNNAITDLTITGNGTTTTPLSIAQQGATSGEVLKWNGTSWAPGADNTGGQTLSISGSTLSISGGNSVTIPASPGDNWGTQTAKTGVTLTGNGTAALPLDMAQQGATTGQVLKWMGAWVPRNDLDNQTLSIKGDSLSIAGGNTIVLPASTGGDNWGTQAVMPDATLKGNGITGNLLGIAQQNATTGQALKWNGTTWLPAADNDSQTLTISGSSLTISNGNTVTLPTGTTYTDGSGILINGSDVISNNAVTDNTLAGNGTATTPLKIAQQSATTGQALKWNGTTWLPAADNDSQTLTISGSSLNISNGNTVTLPTGTTYTDGSGILINGSDVISNNAVTDNTLAGNGTATTPLKIAQQSATTGQALKWNGTTWLPAGDNDSQTLTISGSSLTISNGNTVTLPTGTTYTDGSGILINGSDVISNNAVTDNTLAGNGTATTPLKIAQQGAGNGQILKWNNSSTTWVPENDNDNQTLSLSGNSLTISGGNSVTLPAGDNWGTEVAMTDQTLTGNGTLASPLSIAQDGASTGQVLKWNGTMWVPGTDNNTDGQTLSISGSSLTISNGNTITLPSGDNWGGQVAMTDQTISGNGSTASPLSIAQDGASTGQVLKWNGTIWAPGIDNNTDDQTLSISGSSLTISNGNTITLPSGDNWGSEVVQVNSTISGNGTVGSPIGIAQQSATSGEVLKWNGATWAPAADNDSQTLSITGSNLTISNGNTVTLPAGDNWGSEVVQVNTTITGNGTSGSPLSIAQQGATASQVLEWNGSSWAPATLPATNTYTAGSGISINGSNVIANNAQTDATLTGNGTTTTPLKIAQQGATSGQVLKWNGTTWMPANDNDVQQISLSGNTLSLTNGGSVTLPSGGGGSLNILSTSMTGDNSLEASTFTNIPSMTLTFTPTASNVFMDFSASGYGQIGDLTTLGTTDISLLEIQVLVNGTPVGGSNEKIGVGVLSDGSFDFLAYGISAWSIAFTKMVAVNPGVSNTIVVQYRATNASDLYAPTCEINTVSTPSNHATLTVFNQ